MYDMPLEITCSTQYHNVRFGGAVRKGTSDGCCIAVMNAVFKEVSYSTGRYPSRKWTYDRGIAAICSPSPRDKSLSIVTVYE